MGVFGGGCRIEWWMWTWMPRGTSVNLGLDGLLILPHGPHPEFRRPNPVWGVPPPPPPVDNTLPKRGERVDSAFKITRKLKNILKFGKAKCTRGGTSSDAPKKKKKKKRTCLKREASR